MPDNDMPKPECGSSADAGSYNTPLHVGALFLILILSTCSMLPAPEIPYTKSTCGRHPYI